MKIQTQYYNQSTSTLQGFDMQVDGESNELLMYILAQGYSNPIASVVREYATNAIDAHIEANNMDEPIVIHLDERKFEVQDYGIGMDKERITNVFCKFLGSTKRDSNEIHGGFGLGAKSALSYNDSFRIYTVKDGYYHDLIMRKGTSSIRLETLSEGETDERNGTRITVTLKSKYDEGIFLKAIKNQLAYFDNITFTNHIANDFKIYEGKHFKTSTLSEIEKPVVLLGNVSYPISDLCKLQSGWPIALKFDIGELKVTPYRENVIYDNEAIEKIKEKFNLAVNEINAYRKQVEKTIIDCPKEYFEYLYEVGKYSIIGNQFEAFGKRFYYVPAPIRKYKNFKVLGKADRDINLSQLLRKRINRFYSLDYHQNGNRSRETQANSHRLHCSIVNSGGNFIYVKTNPNFSTVKNKYLVRTYQQDINLYVLNKKLKLSDFIPHLNLKVIPRSEWRTAIQEYLDFERALYNKALNYDDIIVPQSFKDELRKERKKSVNNRTRGINIYLEREGSYGSLFIYDAKKEYSKLCAHDVRTKTIVHHNKDILKMISVMAKNHIKVGYVAPTNYDKLESNDKVIKYDDFISTYSKELVRIATSYRIFESMYEQPFKSEKSIPHLKLNLLSYVNSRLADEYEVFKNYLSYTIGNFLDYKEFRFITTRPLTSFAVRTIINPRPTYYKDLMKVMDDNNWWDAHILSIYERLKKGLAELAFINDLQSSVFINNVSKDYFVIKYLKSQKIRVSNQFYNFKT